MMVKCGHCRRCGFCCEYMLSVNHTYPHDAEYYLGRGAVILKVDEHVTGYENDIPYNYIVALPTHCKHLTVLPDLKLGCDMHGEDDQASVCKLYPYELPNMFYKVLSTMTSCGYHFVEFEPDLCQPMAC